MYVIYHSSDSFARVTGTSMLSLFENNRDMDSIHVLYIEKGISDKNKLRLMEIAHQYNRELEFMTMPNWSYELNIELKSSKKTWLGFGYNRLFLTEFLPQDVDKVLYLDSDTIIESSLKELWNTDIHGYYMAGVDDCLSKNYRNLVGLNENGIYCNAGVLLINVKKWREDNITQKFKDKIIDNNGYFIFNEQSIINSTFEEKILILPLQYNVYSLVYRFELNTLKKLRKPYNYSYTIEEYNYARMHPVITHYTGLFCIKRRPWFKETDHPHGRAFLHFYTMTPWKNEPLEDNHDSIIGKATNVIPERLMTWIASLVYCWLRPIALNIKIHKYRRKV